jgi:hypothetical protein
MAVSQQLIDQAASVMSDLSFVVAQFATRCSDAVTLHFDHDDKRVGVSLETIVSASRAGAEELAEDIRAAARKRGHKLDGGLVDVRVGLHPRQKRIAFICRVHLLR